MPAPRSQDPLTRATEALQIIHTLARRSAPPDRVEREISALIAQWITEPGSIEAIDQLRDQIAVALEAMEAEVDNLDREDTAGVRAGQRVVACLEAARDAVRAALAEL